ncbi:unnamed protein product [Cyclocybe aegerita]|uniref:Uncharacterized protein n=1 Tax=Cyclocybe aegerita TaxID=1973307 RepID=A0A8S0W0G9_CYCAE|nr:unnamed protein product [Cyclocybe aegerita]
MHTTFSRLFVLISLCSLLVSAATQPSFRLRGLETGTRTVSAVNSRNLKQYDPRSPAAIERRRRRALGIYPRQSAAPDDSVGAQSFDGGSDTAQPADNQSSSPSVLGSVPDTLSAVGGIVLGANLNGQDLTSSLPVSGTILGSGSSIVSAPGSEVLPAASDTVSGATSGSVTDAGSSLNSAVSNAATNSVPNIVSGSSSGSGNGNIVAPIGTASGSGSGSGSASL